MRKPVRPISRSRRLKFLLVAVVGVVASVSTVQVASAFFTAHGTGSGGFKMAMVSLDHLTVSPKVASVVVGQDASYTVSAYDNFGGSKDVTSSASLSITHGTCSALAPTCTSDTAGSQTVTASYEGKTAQATQDVDPASTTTSIASTTTSPSLVGQPVTYSAHVAVNAPGAGSPTGYVEFFDAGVAIIGCGDASGNALTGSSASCTVTYDAVGSHTITAEYLGDTNFLASAVSDPITQVVGQASTSTATTTDLSDYVTGQSIVVSASVSPAWTGSGTPTGTVVVTDGVNPAITCSIDLASATSCTIVEHTPGTYTLTGTYSGDANFLGSSASAAPVTVGTGGSTTGGSTTVVSDNASSPTTGDSFTFTVTVSATTPGSGTPAGTVTWTVTDPQGNPVTCPDTTLASGVATCAITNALAGNYSARAQFSDTDGIFSNSGSNTDTVTVAKAGSSAILQTSPSSQTVLTTGEAGIISSITTNDTLATVSFTPSSDHGLAVDASGTITVTGLLAQGTYVVSGTTSDTVGGAGTYSFTLHVKPVAILQTSLTSQTVLTTGEAGIISSITTNDTLATVSFTPSSDHGLAVDASGTITVTGLLAQGTYVVSGTTSDAVGDTGTWTFTLMVNSAAKGEARLELFPQHPQPLLVGASAAFIARVEVLGGPNNFAGTVSFFVGGAPVAGCQNEALTVNASSCTINFPSAGAFTVSATYANDPNFADSTDSSLQVVNRGTTSLSLSSVAPAPPGSQLVYTATVTPTSGSGALGGTVTFTEDGSPLAGCLNVTLSGNSASCSVTFSSPGTFSIRATYASDPNFEGSSDLVTQLVSAPLAITTTSLATAHDGEDDYVQILSATGGTAPYSWSLAAGILPRGLSLNSSTGNITGAVASSATTQIFTVKVTDSLGTSTTKAFTLTVQSRIEFTCGDSAHASAGEGFHFHITTSGPSDRRVSWSGHLPQGVTFDPTTDEFSGTPARGSDGTYVVTLAAGDANESTSQQFTLKVTG
jgi:hypothetical protein